MEKWTPIVSRLLEGTVAEWAGCIAMVVVIVVAIWGIARFRDSLRDDAGHEVANRLLANQIQEMHERGEVSTEEFRSLKQKVDSPVPEIGERVRSEVSRGSRDAINE